MKVTLKMSVLSLLGFGTMAYAQDYEGRVGINTETPAATLDIKSKTGTTSATKNLELQNANGTKLLTVLDDGKIGISTPAEKISEALLTLTRTSENMGGGSIIQMVDNRYDMTDNALTNSISFVDKNKKSYGVIGETSRSSKRFGLNTYDDYDAYLSTGALKYSPNGTATGYTSSSFIYLSSTDTKDRRFRVEINNYNPTLTTEEFFINSKGNVYIGKQLEVGKEVQEKLEVVGNIKSTNLAGSGDRAVFADENGVLKTGTFTTKGSTPTDTETCSTTNEGTMYYKLVDKDGKQVGLFGFCTRDANGEFLWAYQLGGNNLFSVSGNQAFGTGL
ncbi:hypothetical protein ACFFUE_04935 [Bergeyella porcorum]|uniref:hypothetical protein n=1 Tax=Bergeyella porcorum TaxID=1735111 RepID=UPI0035E46BFE